MVNCQFCQANTAQFYLYTLCQHFVCTVCAFEFTDFGMQVLQCCNKQTIVDEEALAIIIKSRRNKPQRHTFNPADEPANPANSPISSNSPLKQLCNNVEQGDKGDIDSKVLKEKGGRRDNMGKKQVLEKIIFGEIQRIRKQFDAEHDKLRTKEEEMIQELIKTYEQQAQTILSHNQDNSDGFQQISSLNHQSLYINQSNSDSAALQTKMSQFNPRIMMVKQPSSRKVLDSDKFQGLESWNNPKKSQEEYDYILKRLEINQQRMNQKLKRHQHITSNI